MKIKDKIIESQVDAINELKFQINDKNDEINRADMQLKRLLKEFTLTSEESDRIRVELDEEKKTKEIMYEDIEVIIFINRNLYYKHFLIIFFYYYLEIASVQRRFT